MASPKLVITIPGTLTSRRPLGGVSRLSTTVLAGTCQPVPLGYRRIGILLRTPRELLAVAERSHRLSSCRWLVSRHGSSVRFGQLAGDAGSEDCDARAEVAGTTGPPGAGPGARDPGSAARPVPPRSATPAAAGRGRRSADPARCRRSAGFAHEREALLVGGPAFIVCVERWNTKYRRCR